jgi:hypothetical protein
MKVNGIDGITAKSPLLTGLVARGGEGFQLAISLKKNGAGKSTLKKVILDSTFKKILPNAEIVKTLELDPDSEDALDEAAIDVATGIEMTENKLGKSVKKAVKVFLWWDQEGRSSYQRVLAGHSALDERFLQTAQRRLEKYGKAKMYNLFEPKWFGLKDGPLQRYRFDDFDMKKSDVKVYLENIERILDQIIDAADDIDDEEIDQLIGNIDFIEEMSVLEELAIQLTLSEGDAIDFIDEAQGYVDLVKKLMIWFTPAQILLLRDFLGDGSWASFFSFATLADNQLKEASDRWGGPKKLIARLKK